MPNDHCNEGLDGRCRDNDGTIREKRGDTRVSTLCETYGEGFAAGFRGDAKLEAVRLRTGRSLSELVHGRRR